MGQQLTHAAADTDVAELAATTGATRTLAAWLAERAFSDLPTTVVERARTSIVDTVGVALAGAGTDASRLASDAVGATGTGATVIGQRARTDAPRAALLNGVAAHALDHDDNSYSMSGHPSAVILPAALAAAETAGASGRRLVAAFVVGHEVAGKLGAAVNPYHFRKGWHATATIGVFGAAAACANVLGLDATRASAALGLAAAMACGIRASLGTMAKPWHVGRAAESGLLAARLAAAGFSASVDAIEGTDGFAHVYADDVFDATPLRRLGDPYELIDPGVMLKRYPCCSALACALDALFEILGSGCERRDVEGIDCELTPLAFASLPYPRPRTGLEAKFSMPFCAAAAVVRGAVDARTFADDVVRDPEIRELMEHVTVRAADAGGWSPADGPEAATVTVRLRDGRTIARRRAFPRGAPADPLTFAEVSDKFLVCAAPAIGDGAARAALSELAQLEALERLDPLLDLLAGRRG